MLIMKLVSCGQVINSIGIPTTGRTITSTYVGMSSAVYHLGRFLLAWLTVSAVCDRESVLDLV